MQYLQILLIETFYSSQYLLKYNIPAKYIWHFRILYFLNCDASLKETGTRMTHLEFILVGFNMCSPCDVAVVWHHRDPYTFIYLFWVLAKGYHLPGCLKAFPQPVDQKVEFYSFYLNILPNISTMWYTIYDIHQILHISTQRYYPQGVIMQRYISQHTNLCSVLFSYRNDKNIQMQKHIKLMTVKYTILKYNWLETVMVYVMYFNI